MSTPQGTSPFNMRLLFVLGLVLALAVGIGLGIGLTSRNRQPEVAEVAESGTPTPAVTPSATATETPLPTPIIITPTPSNTPTPSVTPTPTLTPTPTQTPTPTETPTPSPTPTRVGPLVRALEDAGLFAGPGNSFGRIGFYVPTGVTAVALGISEDGRWMHVVDPASREGWVATRFFEFITGSVAGLSLSDFRTVASFTPSPVPPGAVVAQPSTTPTPGGPTAVPPQTSAVAYWNYSPGSASGNGDGTWRADLVVRVPSGAAYEFRFGDVLQTWVLQRTENDSDVYSLALNGMGCSAPYIQQLVVLQNGAQMVVQNEFTRLPGPIYIQHDC